MRAKRQESQRVAREKREAKARVAAASAAAARAAAEQLENEARVAAQQLAADQRAAETQAAAAATERSKELDVVPWLRALGFRVEDARRAAVQCESFPDPSLEERVRRAVAFLAARAMKQDFRRVDTGEGAPA